MKQAVILPCSLYLLLLAFPKYAVASTTFRTDKSGTLATENGANPTQDSRGKCKMLKQHPTRTAVKALLERAHNALRALTTLESRCKSGISPHEYLHALGETGFEVNQFIESAEANYYPELKHTIIKTMQFYSEVGNYLELSALEAGISRQQGDELEANHIEQKYQGLISQSLSRASQEIAVTYPLLSYCKLQ